MNKDEMRCTVLAMVIASMGIEADDFGRTGELTEKEAEGYIKYWVRNKSEREVVSRKVKAIMEILTKEESNA